MQIGDSPALETSCRGESQAVACDCPHGAQRRSSPWSWGRASRWPRAGVEVVAGQQGPPGAALLLLPPVALAGWWQLHRGTAARGWAPGMGFVMHETSWCLVYVQGTELYFSLFSNLPRLRCFCFPSLGEGIQGILAVGEEIWVQARFSKPRHRRGLGLLMGRWGS